jgi:RNA polymerase sigma-70 factor (ECF subfamily)
MLPLRANGQPAAAAYHRANDGAYHPFAIVALATTSARITRISLSADAALFPRFDLAPRMD